MLGRGTYLFPLLFFFVCLSNGHPHASRHRHGAPHARVLSHNKSQRSIEQLVCINPASVFDYSVKPKWHRTAPMCLRVRDDSLLLKPRQVTDDDYSCSEQKPCSNGACCSKITGYCNYGPAACGTNGQSPNDVCWSNCDAHAECGQYAKVAGAKCPLNVCCSQYGFCGMTADFCTKSDEEGVGCQSNCDQPGSGASGGNVQQKVIGYYEAWAHDRKCAGMDFSKIPVGGLTHLVFSFGFITPGDFNIAPMDALPLSLFSDLTGLKKKNSGLKCMIALGGWTFNDPGPTQLVFSDMVATKVSRNKFIVNLISFMRQYAFDGVDFDWEYPGAEDRGGRESDGINLTQFLKELKEALKSEPIEYQVSFTVPTSYWYLRHFDLNAVDHVDWVNVMSYDLHGIWDSNNPIGSKVLAHTNLTEIKQALDLMWRNDIPAAKLNIGIGFYGRSFQLADTACYQPGCTFKGGASPGGCSGNSGTLTYKEITEIISQYKLTPYHDKEAAVKYIVWNQDQWVSYDDQETTQAKIKFANNLGLGGILIWAVDQDTPKLEALAGVLAPKELNVFQKSADKKSYWDEMTAEKCYVTDCGKGCDRAGFIKVTQQPCGNPIFLFREADNDDSSLCCPIAAAPNPDECRWRGSAPDCNGHCEDGEVMVEMNPWGSGAYCENGNKAYCCDVPAGKQNKCYWSGNGNPCNTGDVTMTFAGTFLSTIADIASWAGLFGDLLADALDEADIALEKRYCCPPAEAKKWTNCGWHGKPGNCFDNHCDVGFQVQLAQSDYGGGESCAPRLERTRVFCCDPVEGQSPFLPVPLDHLFPHPPEGDNIDTDFDMELDNTWGDGTADTQSDNDPNQATFAFWVLTSPEEIQISLDKRDGSHWEVFNCNDATSEEEHTVQMVCTNLGQDSNCGKIERGHGVPGTILELPKGCGPSKYAVAKEMIPSVNQTLPAHLVKRYPHLQKRGTETLIWDLTFDYEWTRVPRDLGDTQMRLDFSNQVGYWDAIVSKAAGSKKKRSLEEMGGNHKRWLEEEWRDDFHFGALSKEEIHKRWFGQSVVEWLRGLLNPSITKDIRHDIDESFTAIIVEEQWGPCIVASGAEVTANLDITATANVRVATSFGLTIICVLALPLDLSQSYLYFKNEGEISAVFTLDAKGRAVFSSDDIELFGLQDFPGATFSIPKLVTIGPNFKVSVAVEAEVTLAGHLESRVDIASWNIQQVFPNQGSEGTPDALDSPNRDMTLSGLRQPTFDWSVSASGSITAHLKPSFVFGIDFDKRWNVGAAKVSLLADGWMRVHAKAEAGSGESTCPFTYGIDVGADLVARAEAPSAFGWDPITFPIAQISPKVLKEGSCPTVATRGLYDPLLPVERNIQLRKRTGVFGPIINIPTRCLWCAKPKDADTDLGQCGSIPGFTEDDRVPDDLFKRDFGYQSWNGTHLNTFGKRLDEKWIDFCKKIAVMDIKSPKFESSGEIASRNPLVVTYGSQNPTDCDDYNFGIVTTPTTGNTAGFHNEHVLEFQLLPKFLDELNIKKGKTAFDSPETMADDDDKVSLCKYMQPYWKTLRVSHPTISIPVTATPLYWIGSVFPGRDNDWVGEFVLLEAGVNLAKEKLWGKSSEVYSGTNMKNKISKTPAEAIQRIKEVLFAYKYHQIEEIKDTLIDQVQRVADMFDTIETDILPNATPPDDKNVYESTGLKAEWLSWMRQRADKARVKAETFLDTHIEGLKNAYYVDDKDTLDASDPQDKDTLDLIERIEKLDEAIQAKGTWVNPL